MLSIIAVTLALGTIMDRPQVIVQPGPEYASATRLFQGIPSMERAPGGRLWATWYGGRGDGEDEKNYIVLVTSGDDGASWSEEVLVVDPDGDGPVRAFDPNIWLDPAGRLWLFWAQAEGHDASVGGVWAVTTDTPDKPDAAWSVPRRLTDGVMMCKPLVLGDGTWALPASTWRDTDNSARMIVSTDKGETWTLRGGCNVPREERAFDEHMFIEKKDGRLWLLARTKYGIGESFSEDGGATWPEMKSSPIAHTSARFFIRRLASGSLLLVKHGPIDQKTGRSHLTAFLSEDDGATWPYSLLLDEREGVSYPDGVQAPDGRMYIIYDFDRTGARQILMAVFTEDDLRAGKVLSDETRLRVLVNEPR